MWSIDVEISCNDGRIFYHRVTTKTKSLLKVYAEEFAKDAAKNGAMLNSYSGDFGWTFIAPKHITYIRPYSSEPFGKDE